MPPSRRSPHERRSGNGHDDAHFPLLRFAAAGKLHSFLTANSDAVGGRSFIHAQTHAASRGHAPGATCAPALSPPGASGRRAGVEAAHSFRDPSRADAQREASRTDPPRHSPRVPAARAALTVSRPGPPPRVRSPGAKKSAGPSLRRTPRAFIATTRVAFAIGRMDECARRRPSASMR